MKTSIRKIVLRIQRLAVKDMGIIKVLKQSRKKTKAMRLLINALTERDNLAHNFNDHSNQANERKVINAKIDFAYEAFFKVLFENEAVGCVLASHQATREQLRDISDRYLALGLRWEKGDYIPVSVISFCKPLNYLLENISVLERESTYDDVINYIYTAKNLLN